VHSLIYPILGGLGRPDHSVDRLVKFVTVLDTGTTCVPPRVVCAFPLALRRGDEAEWPKPTWSRLEDALSLERLEP
jgi:hypothetical protein